MTAFLTPYEDPGKTELRKRCSVAIDAAAYEEVPDPVNIVPPELPGVELQGHLKGDLQSLDGEQVRHCYYLRTNGDAALPGWLVNLAMSVRTMTDVRLSADPHGQRPEGNPDLGAALQARGRTARPVDRREPERGMSVLDMVPTAPEPERKRVVLYLRISTDEENQPTSLGVQEKDTRGYVGKRGWNVVRVLTDEMSGAKLDRPGLQELLRMATNKEFDILVVHKLDRLSRDPMIHHTVVTHLATNGIRIVSSAENFDLDESSGRLLAGVMNLVASYERDAIIDRITRANAFKAAGGRFTGGLPPYGFDKTDDHILVPHPTEAALVQRVFQMYVHEGLGAAAVRSRLNDEGHRTRRKVPWTSQAILDMLRNPAYNGQIRRHEEVFDGLHDAIIEPETWALAQNRLTERAARPRPLPPNDSTYLLTGVLRCALCDSAYVGTAANNRFGSRYRYYTCSRRTKSGKLGCANVRLRADLLEQAVIDTLVSTYESTDLFCRAAEEAAATEPARLASARQELTDTRAKVAQASRAINMYYADYEDDRVPKDLAWSRIDHKTEERKLLEVRIQELEQEIGLAHPGPPSTDDVTRVGTLLRDAFLSEAYALVRELLAHLVAEIRIHENGQIQPTLWVPGCPAQT